MQKAAQILAARVRDAVGHELGIPSNEVVSGNGRWFSVRDPSIGLTCAEAFVAAESAFGTLGATGGYHTDKSLGGNYRGGTIGASPAYSFTAHASKWT